MTEPFLTETEAPLPQQRNGRRVLILWVVLIVMFLAIWRFLSPDPHPHSGTPATSPQSRDGSI